MREVYRGMGIDHVVIPEYFVGALFGDKKWLLGRLAHQEPRIMRQMYGSLLGSCSSGGGIGTSCDPARSSSNDVQGQRF
jgi:hypothetical protein